MVGRRRTEAELLRQESRGDKTLSPRALVAGLAVLLGGAWALSGDPGRAAAEGVRPRLVVFVSVDQMRLRVPVRASPRSTRVG